MKRLPITVLAVALCLGLLAPPAVAQPFPDTLVLPNGFSPEGVAIADRVGYFGSLVDGSIQRIDLKTGDSDQLAPSPGSGKIAVGLDVDRFGRLWVAGGGSAFFPGVQAGFRVYDTTTGTLLADVPVAAAFVNDVIVTDDAAWFTDTFGPALIRVPIGPDGGLGAPESVLLAGEWASSAGLNANGIEASADGKNLIVAQTQAADGLGAALYAMPADVDAAVVDARRISLDGSISSADGLVLIGRTLYVVGAAPAVVEIKLSRQLTQGRIVDEIEVDAASPTTADVFGATLYVVDADFANLGNPAAAFKAVAVQR